MRHARWFGAASAAAALAAVVACSAPGLDKAGGDVRVLRFATIDSVNDSGESFGPAAFVAALGRTSGGRLEVLVDTERFGGGQAQDEADLVTAIAGGQVDGGWPATRAFARAGIDGLGIVEMPFVISSYAAQRELVQSAVADDLLGRLDGSGVHGLALTVGPLRRPFSVGPPLVAPEHWNDVAVGTKNSPIQEETVQSLGGRPVRTGYADNHGLAAAPPVLATELDIVTYWSNDMVGSIDHVPADVVLWPKMPVLVVSESLWSSLSEQERAWVSRAASVARQASVRGPYDDAGRAATLCRRGLTVSPTTPAQRQQLVDAVRPVHDALAADPLTDELLAIGRRHPDPESLAGPGGCPAQPPPSPTPSDGSSGAAGPDFPSGTYRVRITRADLADAGIGNGPGWSGTWTMTVEDGTYSLTCRPVDDPGKDCGNAEAFSSDVLEAGPVTVDGTRVTFRDHLDRFHYSATWSQDGSTMTFTGAVGEPVAPVNLTLRPWTRIA